MTATLRDLLHELADQAKPVELAAPALRKARRIRARRFGLTAVGVVAALGLPFYLVPRADHAASVAPPQSVPATSPAVIPSDTPGPTLPPGVLPGRLIFGGGSGQEHPWVYDRARGSLRTVSYRFAYPAPVGDLVAVERQNGWAGILDLRTDQVKQVAPTGSGWSLGVPEWSADGRRLLRITQSGRIFVTDAVTGTSKEILPQGNPCELCNSVVWMPGEEQFAYYDSNRPGGQTAIHAIADGRLLRTVPWKPGANTAFSPSGERVFTEDGIFDVATGTRISAAPSINDQRVVYWAEPDRILVIDHGEVRIYSASGSRIGTVPWPAQFVDDELPNFTLIKG